MSFVRLSSTHHSAPSRTHRTQWPSPDGVATAHSAVSNPAADSLVCFPSAMALQSPVPPMSAASQRSGLERYPMLLFSVVLMLLRRLFIDQLCGIASPVFRLQAHNFICRFFGRFARIRWHPRIGEALPLLNQYFIHHGPIYPCALK